MKGRMLLLSIPAILLALNQIQGWCQGEYVPKVSEEIYGTWINEKGLLHKVVNAPGGYKEYARVSDSVADEEGTLRIDSKWIDSEGNIWYKCLSEITSEPQAGWKTQGLDKVSKSGTVWEHVGAFVAAEFDPSHYPTKIDPKSPSYFILYRAEE